MSEEKIVDPAAAPADADDASVETIWNELANAKTDQGKDPPGKAGDDLKVVEETPKVETPAAPSVSQAEDPWKDAPPELREAHERDLAEIRTRAEQAEVTARRHSGRLSKQEQELAALRARLAPSRDETGAATEEAKTREDRRKQLREEYPDSVGPVLDELVALEESVRELKGSSDRQAEDQQQSRLIEQTSLVEKAHPNWETEIANTDAFVKWAVDQPEYMKAAIRDNAKVIVSADDVIDVLDRFKRDTGTDDKAAAEVERKKEQLEAGRDPSVRNPSPAAPKGEGSTEQIWNELQEERRRKEAQNQRR